MASVLSAAGLQVSVSALREPMTSACAADALASSTVAAATLQLAPDLDEGAGDVHSVLPIRTHSGHLSVLIEQMAAPVSAVGQRAPAVLRAFPSILELASGKSTPVDSTSTAAAAAPAVSALTFGSWRIRVRPTAEASDVVTGYVRNARVLLVLQLEPSISSASSAVRAVASSSAAARLQAYDPYDVISPAHIARLQTFLKAHFAQHFPSGLVAAQALGDDATGYTRMNAYSNYVLYCRFTNLNLAISAVRFEFPLTSGDPLHASVVFTLDKARTNLTVVQFYRDYDSANDVESGPYVQFSTQVQTAVKYRASAELSMRARVTQRSGPLVSATLQDNLNVLVTLEPSSLLFAWSGDVLADPAINALIQHFVQRAYPNGFLLDDSWCAAARAVSLKTSDGRLACSGTSGSSALAVGCSSAGDFLIDCSAAAANGHTGLRLQTLDSGLFVAAPSASGGNVQLTADIRSAAVLTASGTLSPRGVSLQDASGWVLTAGAGSTATWQTSSAAASSALAMSFASSPASSAHVYGRVATTPLVALPWGRCVNVRSQWFIESLTMSSAATPPDYAQFADDFSAGAPWDSFCVNATAGEQFVFVQGSFSNEYVHTLQLGTSLGRLSPVFGKYPGPFAFREAAGALSGLSVSRGLMLNKESQPYVSRDQKVVHGVAFSWALGALSFVGAVGGDVTALLHNTVAESMMQALRPRSRAQCVYRTAESVSRCGLCDVSFVAGAVPTIACVPQATLALAVGAPRVTDALARLNAMQMYTVTGIAATLAANNWAYSVAVRSPYDWQAPQQTATFVPMECLGAQRNERCVRLLRSSTSLTTPAVALGAALTLEELNTFKEINRTTSAAGVAQLRSYEDFSQNAAKLACYNCLKATVCSGQDFRSRYLNRAAALCSANGITSCANDGMYPACNASVLSAVSNVLVNEKTRIESARGAMQTILTNFALVTQLETDALGIITTALQTRDDVTVQVDFEDSSDDALMANIGGGAALGSTLLSIAAPELSLGLSLFSGGLTMLLDNTHTPRGSVTIPMNSLASQLAVQYASAHLDKAIDSYTDLALLYERVVSDHRYATLVDLSINTLPNSIDLRGAINSFKRATLEALFASEYTVVAGPPTPLDAAWLLRSISGRYDTASKLPAFYCRTLWAAPAKAPEDLTVCADQNGVTLSPRRLEAGLRRDNQLCAQYLAIPGVRKEALLYGALASYSQLLPSTCSPYDAAALACPSWKFMCVCGGQPVQFPYHPSFSCTTPGGVSCPGDCGDCGSDWDVPANTWAVASNAKTWC